jgi:hypothetical protein
VVVVHIYDKGYYLMMKSYSSVAVKFTTKVEFEFHYRVSVGLYKGTERRNQMTDIAVLSAVHLM